MLLEDLVLFALAPGGGFLEFGFLFAFLASEEALSVAAALSFGFLLFFWFPLGVFVFLLMEAREGFAPPLEFFLEGGGVSSDGLVRLTMFSRRPIFEANSFVV